MSTKCKNRFHHLFLAISAASLLGFTVFTGCGGGGGGDGDSTGGSSTAVKADMSEAAVEETLANIGDYVSGCTEIDAGAAAIPSAVTQNTGALNEFVRIVAKNWKNSVSTAAVPDFTEDIVAGDCAAAPGTMTITRAHESGTTTYAFIFDGFCTESSSDPSDQTIIDGDVTYRQVGTPSDQGPVISQLALSVNDLSITADGVETIISLGTLGYTFGTPAVSPATPTESAPDRITLDSLEIDYASIDKVHKLSGVDVTVYEAGTSVYLTVNSSRYASDTKGYVDITTPEPLIMDDDADIVGGTLNIAGEGGTLSLSPQTLPSGEATGIIDIELNGEPMDSCLDCSELSGIDDLLLSL